MSIYLNPAIWTPTQPSVSLNPSFPPEIFLHISSFAEPSTLGTLAISCKELTGLAIDSANKTLNSSLQTFVNRLILNLDPNQHATAIQNLHQVKDQIEIPPQESLCAHKTSIAHLENSLLDILANLNTPSLQNLETNGPRHDLMSAIYDHAKVLQEIHIARSLNQPDKFRKLEECSSKLVNLTLANPINGKYIYDKLIHVAQSQRPTLRTLTLKRIFIDLTRAKAPDKCREVYDALILSARDILDRTRRYNILSSLSGYLKKAGLADKTQRIFGDGWVSDISKRHSQHRRIFCAVATILTVGTIIGLTLFGVYKPNEAATIAPLVGGIAYPFALLYSYWMVHMFVFDKHLNS